MHLINLNEAIEKCLEAKLVLPAIILIYAGIDVVASLEKKIDEKQGESFKNWVDKYLLAANKINCTSEEIWSARCGILHTLTPESNFTKTGQARRIYYAWGNASLAEMSELMANKNYDRNDIIFLHVNDLSNGFKKAIIAWFKEIVENAERRKMIQVNASKLFVDIPAKIVNELVNNG